MALQEPHVQVFIGWIRRILTAALIDANTKSNTVAMKEIVQPSRSSGSGVHRNSTKLSIAVSWATIAPVTGSAKRSCAVPFTITFQVG